MYLKLRIFFTILSAVCVAAALPVGAVLGFVWAGILALSAFLFYGLMLLCKQNQESSEKSIQPLETEQSDKTKPLDGKQEND
ncbi:MAG: hypothetical protein J6A38_04145 [Clostridia bacterium]|nr:hypothetical protein [Clostridia bacterium]